MKQLISFFYLLFISLLSFAQKGRTLPEDYMDYEDFHYTTHSESSPVFYLIIFVVMVVGVVLFKIFLNASRKKEISNKTSYLTESDNVFGFKDGCSAKQNSYRYYEIEQYFVEQNGVVAIPRLSRCIILEYWPDDHSFVKVQFDNYPTPLYIGRWHLQMSDKVKA